MNLPQVDNNNNKSNIEATENLSSDQKMELDTIHKSKVFSDYWIEHYKFMQKLKNQFGVIKMISKEKKNLIQNICIFDKETELINDNLYLLSSINNQSELELDNNTDELKQIQKKEEEKTKKVKEDFKNITDNYKKINIKNNEIEAQKKLLTSWYQNIEGIKNEVDSQRDENSNSIDSISENFSKGDNKYKNLEKTYKLISNILKYRIENVEDDKKDSYSKIIKGYFLNSKKECILNYNIKIKNNDSLENKANDIFNFWESYLNFNNPQDINLCLK